MNFGGRYTDVCNLSKQKQNKQKVVEEKTLQAQETAVSKA